MNSGFSAFTLHISNTNRQQKEYKRIYKKNIKAGKVSQAGNKTKNNIKFQ
jgi:hypothetical protein